MTIEGMAHEWVGKMRRTVLESDKDNNLVYDAQAIDAMVREIVADGYRAGIEAGTYVKKEPRKLRRFTFDVPKLQAAAREKMLADGRSWQDISDDIGVAVSPLKKHLSETPPKEMGLNVAISLMVYTGDFDALGYLQEEEIVP